LKHFLRVRKRPQNKLYAGKQKREQSSMCDRTWKMEVNLLSFSKLPD
jgi:hypothetical protein